jgi:hypothetical protein
MPTTDLLKTFGLSRNPFTDRTAEKTAHDDTSLYIHRCVLQPVCLSVCLEGRPRQQHQ